jgi:ATP-dependent RNA helicase DDX51/DBP6
MGSRKRQRRVSRAVALPVGGQESGGLQRLLFSATLTDNPRKLSLTGIRNPLVIRTSRLPTINVDSGSSANLSRGDAPTAALPSTLTENICVCKTSKRPLVLLSILMDACGSRETDQSAPRKTTPSYVNCSAAPDDIILIFASSVESTHRLCRLVQIFNQQLSASSAPTGAGGGGQSLLLRGQVREITRLVRAEDRSAALQMARGAGSGSAVVETDWGRVKVLVASDQLARGIDLKNIRLVINYDPPAHARTYVHRVGRTARAQRTGHCITILKQGQEGEFKKMRAAVDSNVDRLLRDSKIEPPLSPRLKEQYTAALADLGQVIRMEADGILKAGEF